MVSHPVDFKGGAQWIQSLKESSGDTSKSEHHWDSHPLERRGLDKACLEKMQRFSLRQIEFEIFYI